MASSLDISNRLRRSSREELQDGAKRSSIFGGSKGFGSDVEYATEGHEDLDRPHADWEAEVRGDVFDQDGSEGDDAADPEELERLEQQERVAKEEHERLKAFMRRSSDAGGAPYTCRAPLDPAPPPTPRAC
jgi:hypothetical protein